MTRGVLAVAVLLGGLVASASSFAAGPPDGYKLQDDHNEVSPDKSTTVEQYLKENKDGDWAWQFWARHGDSFTMLAPEQDDYPADFRFTPDSQWLIRLQKTGSGEGTMYLYHLTPKGFISATRKPFGDMAWDFFNSRPESKKVQKPDFHFYVGLIKGIADNYKSLGENWPNNRYIVIGLDGELEPTHTHHQLAVVRGWQCRYDLTTGKFDVPESFAKVNIEALRKDKQSLR
jgi:hypothetical protein